MMRQRDAWSASGSVLLTVMAIALCCALVTGTLMYIVAMDGRVETLRSQQRQAYWDARQVAGTLLQAATAGALNAGSAQYTFENGTVTTKVTQATSWQVEVRAEVAGAVDTVSFSYDATRHQVVSWRDNGPWR